LFTRRLVPPNGLGGRISLRRAAIGGLVGATALALVAVAAAYTSASYADPAGDANEAPDIASVTVDDAGVEAVSVRVAFGNFRILPPDARVLLRFDLDRNEATGAQGDEITIRYSSDGTLDFRRWNGDELVPLPATGLSASFSDGVLAYTVDRAQLAGATSFALVAVAERTQDVGIGRVISTDFAPGSGRNVYSSPGPASFPDPDGDHDVAPDITSISVSDTTAGAIRFRLTTANYATLPDDKLIGIGIDVRGRPATDDELFVGYVSGSKTVEVDREQRGLLQPAGPAGVTASHADGVLTFTVPRNRLDGASAFGFGVVSADLVGPGESEGEEFEGEVEALDTAPDDLTAGLYSYRLANKGPLRLRAAGAVAGSPALPRAGRSFSAGVVVRRLDTYGVVRTGSVTCTASVAGTRVPASGRFRGGRAECRLQVPRGRATRVLRGTIAIRVSGASIRSRYSFVVR
jgi:hypothetical protein